MHKSCAVILLLVLPIHGMAAEWIQVPITSSPDRYFYDRSKLVVQGNEVTFWKRVIFKTPTAVSGKWVASGLYRERIHCTEHTLKLLSHLLYSPEGQQLEYVAHHEGEAAAIIPDTLGDVFEQALCPLSAQVPEQTLPPTTVEPLKTPSTDSNEPSSPRAP